MGGHDQSQARGDAQVVSLFGTTAPAWFRAKPSFRLLGPLAGAALVLLLAGCGAGTPAGSPPPTSLAPSTAAKSVSPLSPPVHLKVGVNQTLSESGLYIGLEKGYFRDEGLEVELTTLPSIQDMVP